MEELHERAEARVGEALTDKWTLVRLLGVGGMAAVYEARHRNQKRAAIKILHRELSVDSKIRQRFLREGYVANSVEHPGAVTVDDDDTAEDGSAFLVMELLEGETLDARFKRSRAPLPPADVLLCVDQLLDTLTAAHAKGVVHRDLKPENIFITLDGTVKVLDFGIARLRELSGGATATTTGTLMGTPAFMAPEQAKGRWDEVDAQTDLWAVGATMYTLLTGELVHHAETLNEALAMAMMQAAPPVGSRNEDLTPALCELVDRALAYDKCDRWSSARVMREALEEVAMSMGVELGPRREQGPRTSLGEAVREPAAAADAPDQPESPRPRSAALVTIGTMTATTQATRGRSRWPIFVAIGGFGLGAAGVYILSQRNGADGETANSASASATQQHAGPRERPPARGEGPVTETSSQADDAGEPGSTPEPSPPPMVDRPGSTTGAAASEEVPTPSAVASAAPTASASSAAPRSSATATTASAVAPSAATSAAPPPAPPPASEPPPPPPPPAPPPPAPAYGD